MIVGRPCGQFQGLCSVDSLARIFFICDLLSVSPTITDILQAFVAKSFSVFFGLQLFLSSSLF